jgi:GntR family transcriptional regulator / MocR family aminotransferase
MILLTHQSCLHRIPIPQKIDQTEEGVRVKTTIRVNRKRPESMTKQITDQLTSLIESGAMTVGSYLPSERELANSLRVARNVVRGSYENLMKAGRIQSEGRKGRTVRSAGKKRAGAAKSTKSAAAKARKK